MKVRCNNCMAVFDEPEIIYNEKSNTEASRIVVKSVASWI